MSDTSEAAAPTAEKDAPTLQITDIQDAIRVIDFAAEQGAFKGWRNIEQVLMVRNRLNDFLRYVLPAAAPDAEKVGADATPEPAV